jgi:hypothetical protein
MHVIQSQELKNFNMTRHNQQKEMQGTSRESCHLILPIDTVGTQAPIQLLALPVYPPVTRPRLYFNLIYTLHLCPSSISYKLHINNDCAAIKPEIKYYVLCLMSYQSVSRDVVMSRDLNQPIKSDTVTSSHGSVHQLCQLSSYLMQVAIILSV